MTYWIAFCVLFSFALLLFFLPRGQKNPPDGYEKIDGLLLGPAESAAITAWIEEHGWKNTMPRAVEVESYIRWALK